MRPQLISARLRYCEIEAGDIDAFHRLVTDPHVLRYLMDGEVLPRSWSEQAIATSVAAFANGGLGLWLAWKSADSSDANPIGFCGFWVFGEIEPEPQLLYAFVESATGRGYATETANSLVRYAREHAGMTDIRGAVDAPNLASIRVLEKIGFERCGSVPGAFGETHLFVLKR